VNEAPRDPVPAGSTTPVVSSPASSDAVVGEIIARLHAFLAEVRCLGSQGLVQRGVSMTHVHVLALLGRHGEMSMSRLADFLGVGLSTVTGLVDRMEERGLVERFRDLEDRRLVFVRPTARGREVLDELDLLRDDLMARVLAELTPEQRDRLARAIDDLRQAVARVAAADPSTGGRAVRGGSSPLPPSASDRSGPSA
jgi:DNA-binding MarR family transcriptional regulator